MPESGLFRARLRGWTREAPARGNRYVISDFRRQRRIVLAGLGLAADQDGAANVRGGSALSEVFRLGRVGASDRDGSAHHEPTPHHPLRGLRWRLADLRVAPRKAATHSDSIPLGRSLAARAQIPVRESQAHRKIRGYQVGLTGNKKNTPSPVPCEGRPD